MKKLFFLPFTIFTFTIFAQDSLGSKKNEFVQDSSSQKKNWGNKNEIGVNATLLLKQILSLSNSTVNTLPYNITYKHFCNKKWAFRTGIGFNVTNSSTSSSTASSSSAGTGPDQIAPTINRSFSASYRIGMEYRYRVSKRVVVYAGFDLAGFNLKSTIQNTQLSNNLPVSYQYSKTTDNLSSVSFGGGLVGGLQFYISRRISVFTEMPIYFFYNTQKEVTNNYRNVLQNSSGQYFSTDNTQTQLIKNTNFTLSLPVTIYLGIKF
jgi:hypothetical protein